MAPGARATAQPAHVRIRACATNIANAFQRALHQGPSAGAGGGSSSGKAEAVAGEARFVEKMDAAASCEEHVKPAEASAAIGVYVSTCVCVCLAP